MKNLETTEGDSFSNCSLFVFFFFFFFFVVVVVVVSIVSVLCDLLLVAIQFLYGFTQ